MPNNGVSIRVLGIRELVSAFRAVDREIPSEMKTSLFGIVASIAGKIASKFPYVGGGAAGSVKPKASPRGGAIVFGGTAAPYAPWLDFGGRVGRNKSISRPFIRKGRYVYPTIAESHDEIARKVEEAVIRVAEQNSFGVR